MDHSSRVFSLHLLPRCFRLGLACLVVTLLGGYIVSGLHLRSHYENRDDAPGLTMNDIIGAYHGVRSPSPLISALESGHPESLGVSDRSALLDWLRGDRVSQDYDNLDLGEEAPSEVIAMSCLDCHTRSASGGDSAPGIPLEYWDDIRDLAYSKDIQPAGADIVAMSQHTHAPTMAVILIVLAMLGAWTRVPIRLVGVIVLLSGMGLLVDMSSWWITREIAGFAYAVVIGGFVYAIGAMLLGLLIVLDCVLPARKRLPD